MSNAPILGIIGGSGLYEFPGLSDVERIEADTPFGRPSSPIILGSLNGKRVAFLARHGIGHFINPTEVNYRANIYAFKALGIQRVLSISACGSLRDDYAPGHIVIPDQLVDFTRKRKSSFFEDGLVAHAGVADPYCSEFSRLVYQAVGNAGAISHMGGALVTIEGPRFSTRGESNLFRSWGMSIIGMTASPEAFLAREAEMCYCTMAHVTDYDVWHVSEEPVSVEMVIRTLLRNTQVAQQAVRLLVEQLPETITCGCDHAMANAFITRTDVIPPETRSRLGILINKYLQA